MIGTHLATVLPYESKQQIATITCGCWCAVEQACNSRHENKCTALPLQAHDGSPFHEISQIHDLCNWHLVLNVLEGWERNPEASHTCELCHFIY